jgi:hypothetical protein
MSDDDRLEQALQFANYKSAIIQQRENLRLRYVNAVLHAHNGGIFTVTPSLMCFIDLLIRQAQTETVLLDDKQLPIRITDLEKFLEDIVGVYAEASNEYLVGWNDLRKARSVEAAVLK